MSGFPALIVEERELISRCIAQGYSARDIGRLTGRHHSTISREIERNGGADAYRVVRSQDRCDAQRARPREHRLVAVRRLHDEVNRGLTRKWSPEQISARLVVAHPDDPEMRVSHETIYQTLYLQARGELRTAAEAGAAAGKS